MGVTFNIGGAADAPDIEDGVYGAKFLGVELQKHPDWAGVNQFGKEDSGDRFHWTFVICENGEPVYDEGEPLELEATTNTTMAAKSNAAGILKGLLTPAEYSAAEAGNGPKDSDIEGRMCQVTVEHSKSGWPRVVGVTAVPQPVKAKRSLRPQAAE